jgi:hypothetical protein
VPDRTVSSSGWKRKDFGTGRAGGGEAGHGRGLVVDAESRTGGVEKTRPTGFTGHGAGEGEVRGRLEEDKVRGALVERVEDLVLRDPDRDDGPVPGQGLEQGPHDGVHGWFTAALLHPQLDAGGPDQLAASPAARSRKRSQINRVSSSRVSKMLTVASTSSGPSRGDLPLQVTGLRVLRLRVAEGGCGGFGKRDGRKPAAMAATAGPMRRSSWPSLRRGSRPTRTTGSRNAGST